MADRKLVHVERIPIRWGDMDAMGHVNNASCNYMKKQKPVRIPEGIRSLLQ